MTTHNLNLFCSNQLGRIILQGMEEVMGGSNLQALLARTSVPGLPAVQPLSQGGSQAVVPCGAIAGIQAALEEVYGDQPGRGLALRSGRAAFQYGLRLLDELANLTSISYRLLPARIKVPTGARALAQSFNQLCDGQARLEEGDHAYRWIVEQCPVCAGRHSDGPACHLTVGFLQEYLAWATAGKYYRVTETECAAAGAAACVFTIDKQASE